MTVQVKKDIDQKPTPKSEQTKPQQEPQVSENQIKEFLKQYELKKLSVEQMYKIYSKNVFSPYFENTFKSAIFLIVMPALTNIYYTFRAGSPLASVLPIAMPLLCLTQYFYVINKDFERFCFNNSQDSKELREKYKILYAYSLNDKIIDNVAEDIFQFEKKQTKKDLV